MLYIKYILYYFIKYRLINSNFKKYNQLQVSLQLLTNKTIYNNHKEDLILYINLQFAKQCLMKILKINLKSKMKYIF